MRALFFDKTATLKKNHPKPEPLPGEALIRITLAGVCATDLHIMAGYHHFQGVLGHEFVGVVEACEDPSWSGVRVVGEINCACGVCFSCRQGKPSHCSQRTVPGILGRDGVFAEYCTLPLKNLHALPISISDPVALFTEPLAAALEIPQQVHIRPSDRVVVVGDGRLGLLVAQVLALSGCELLVVGHHPQKWSVLQSLGIPACLDTKVSSGFKADIVVECTGCPSGFNVARKLLLPQGKLILKSTYAEKALINLSDLVVHEITLIGSRCGPFAPAIHLLRSNRIVVEPLIAATYPLEQGIEALQHAQQKGTLKTLIKPF